MPPPPDNPLDDVLKAYARKRREELGAPLEPHPATRQLLRAEVARTFPRKSKVSWFEVVSRFWPRLAFAVSILLVVGLGTWSLLKTNRATRQFSKLDQKAESKARAFDGAGVPVTQALAAAEAEKLIELGINQTNFKFKAVEAETRQWASPQNRPKLDSRDAEDNPTGVKRVGATVEETGQSERLLRRRYGLDESVALQPVEKPAPQPLIIPAQKPDAISGAEPALKLNEKASSLGRLSLQAEAKRELDASSTGPPAPTLASALTPETGKESVLDQRKASPLPGGRGFGGGGPGAGAGFGGALESELSKGIAASGAAAAQQFYFVAPYVRFEEANQPSAPNDLLDPLHFSGSFLFSDLALTRFANTNQVAATRSFPGEGIGLPTDQMAATALQQQDLGPNALALYSAREPGGSAEPTKLSEINSRFRMTNQIVRENAPSSDVAQQSSFDYRNGRILADKLQAQSRAKSDPAPTRNRAVMAPESARAASILSTFEVEQAADRIRIIEPDGSVYEGRLLAEEAGRERLYLTFSPTEKKTQLGQRVDRYDRSELSRAAGAATEVFFQASGTNRSLNQVVVINGSLSGNTVAGYQKDLAGQAIPAVRSSTTVPSAPAPVQSVPRFVNGVSAAAAADRASQGALLPAGRVVAPWVLMTGKARVGATNEIQIHAVLLKP